MSDENKEFFRNLLDIIKLFWCQRDALFEICEHQLKNWEPVYRVLQGEPERIRRADEFFHCFYASVEDGKRDVESLKRLPKDDLKSKPN